MIEEAKGSFLFLKPYCVDVCQRKDLKSIQQLGENLTKSKPSVLNELQKYILFPFQVVLKDNVKEDVVITVAECLGNLLKTIKIDKWVIFEDLYKVFCMKITRISKSDFLEPQGSEDLKYAVVHCLTQLIGKSGVLVRDKFYSSVNLPLLGHLVHVLLQILQSEKVSHLQVECVNCIKQVYKPDYLSDLDKNEQQKLQRSIGDCMASFLPGISSAMASIILSSKVKASKKVVNGCLRLLKSVFVITLGDNNLVGSEENLKPGSSFSEEMQKIIIVRNQKWVDLTSSKLHAVLGNISNVSNIDTWTVRLEVLKLFQALLNHCEKSLKNCANVLLRVPIKLLNDEYIEISDLSDKILNEYSQKLHGNKEKNKNMVFEILEENIFSLCNELPMIIKRSSDDDKLSNLNLILGYMTLLKDKMEVLFQSSVHFKKLCSALLMCYELDLSSVFVLDQVTQKHHVSELVMSTSRMKKQFCHFQDNRILNTLNKICQRFGQYINVDNVINYFLDIFITSEPNCKQALLIICEVLIGANSNLNLKSEELVSIIESILQEILSPKNWHIVTSNVSVYNSKNDFQTATNRKKTLVAIAHATAGVTLKKINHNVLLSCVLMESIQVYASILGCRFDCFLMDVLYPLLEKCNDENPVVSTFAVKILHDISKSCNFKDISELITQNSDYIVSTVSIQLLNLEMFPRSPAVLKAMLDNCDTNLVPLIEDTINEMLLTLDVHHFSNDHLFVFLPVLSSIVKTLCRFMQHSTKSEEKAPKTELLKTNENDNFESELLEFFQNYDKAHRISTLEEKPEIEENKINNENDEDVSLNSDDEEEVIQVEVKIAEKVLHRCLNLLSHESLKVRLCVLNVVIDGIKVLEFHETTLLTTTHKIWSPLIVRLYDSELQVVMQAFDTICMLAESCKEFLRKRICSDVLYKILNFLKSNAQANSYTKNAVMRSDQNFAQKHHVLFKLQKKALNGLGTLLKNAKVSYKDIFNTSKCCFVYLSCRQHHDLQDAAIVLFKHLIDMDANGLWLFLNDIISKASIVEPHFESNLNIKFEAIKLRGSNEHDNVYYNNVKKLLEYF